MLPDTHPVLAHYPPDCRTADCVSLGSAGGFSGAAIWKLSVPQGALALRRWPPEHPSPRRLAWIHAVAAHAAQRGFGLLPLPITALDGRSFVHHDGRRWELAPWMPGEADYRQRPSRRRLENAMLALARFHRSVEDFEHVDMHRSPSPGAADRRIRIAKLLAGELAELSEALVSRTIPPEVADAGRRWVALFPAAAGVVAPLLDEAACYQVAQQPCLRDVWSDHVLFTGDDVSGIVDLGAMRTESVATDVARLLGSLVGDDGEGRLAGLASYESVRPLGEQELRLATAIDRGNVVLSGTLWLRWLLVEGRQFDDIGAIVGRLQMGLTRLETLARSAKPAVFE
jgi:homoserine kinase type II